VDALVGESCFPNGSKLSRYDWRKRVWRSLKGEEKLVWKGDAVAQAKIDAVVLVSSVWNECHPRTVSLNTIGVRQQGQLPGCPRSHFHWRVAQSYLVAGELAERRFRQDA
jgi:hypothetical protein